MKRKLKKIINIKYVWFIFKVNSFFGTATQIVSQFDEILGTKYLILNYEADALLDISAIFALEDIIIRLNNQKIKLMLIIKNDDVRKQLKDLNIVKQIGENHIFYNETDAINLAKTCIKTKIRRQNKQDKKRI
ncbi:MAG: sodium-independent anion transporter [Candidatus Melainabacteria bacterium]|nr:MAG: sodium-independent anion transporter [Candidatus Melainabacteria bacterium]